MSTPHVATPEHWAYLQRWAADGGRAATGLVELRARVEALEEAENDRRFEQAKAIIDKPAPAPTGSLVERVADAIVEQATSAGIVNDRPARAAIREVATWLRDRGGYPCDWTAQMLEKEAGR